MTEDLARTLGPAQVGTTVRDGVRLAWQVHGEGETTLVMMPTWSIIHSRFWKAQVPYLSRHFRVVTFDGRGCGRSGRPQGAAAYAEREFAEDTVAVMDATGTEAAVLVSLSAGGAFSLHVAAEHPDRVLGLFAVGPSCSFDLPRPLRDEASWDERYETHEGWRRFNRHYWVEGGHEDFLSFFFGEMFCEPHSTKQIEDCVGWGLETPPQVLVDTIAARLGLEGASVEPPESLCARVRCPVTVVHGTEDRITPPAYGEAMARHTGGSLVLIEGAGHGPQARQPVVVNRLIKDFVDRIRPPVSRRTWVAAPRRRRRALYLSSPIGLGHARRDLAIVGELRKLQPDLEVDWLTQHPVTAVLEAAGERVHPASRWLASESGHFEHEAGEHDLHAFQAIRRMDEILVHNFMVFAELVEQEDYDLVVGDEAWDVDHFLHENPELKRFPFAWLTDFVGWLPMPDGGPAEAALTADYNEEMLEQRARFARVRDRSVFVGNPEDVVPTTFGPGLPRIDDWVRQHFDFSGYVTGFDPTEVADRSALRDRLGLEQDRPYCVVTVGGSGVGEPMLRRTLDAVPLLRRQLPGLQVLVVAGPRIDPRSLPRRRGATVRGHVPDLYRHLGAADVAVVQGGLTTTMELTASRTPFVYVPLRHHFEQNLHVRHRLDRYDAGRCLEYDVAADPDALAEAVVAELGREVDYRPVESDGAARAARLLAELV